MTVVGARGRVPTVIGAPTSWIWIALVAGLVVYAVARLLVRRWWHQSLPGRADADRERFFAEYRERQAGATEREPRARDGGHPEGG